MISELSKGFLSFLIGGLLLFAVVAGGCRDQSPQPSSAQAKLIIATDTTLVPMSFIGDQAKLIGFEPDLIANICKIAGFDYEMISVAWPGLFGGLITHKFDMVISSVTILEERKKRMAFSNPYLKSGLALVVRKETQGVESLADVKAKNLLAGAQIGTTAYFYLENDPAIRKKGYEAYGHAITDLINGELDAVLGESTGTLYYKNQREEYFKQIKMVGEIITEEYYGIVLRKQDKELLQKINHAIDQLLQDGTIAKLHAKWNLGKAAQLPK